MSDKVVTPGSLLTEKEWHQTVVQVLRLRGWVLFHDTLALRSAAGYPDITAVHPVQRRVLWVEAKSTTGRVTASQERWIDALSAAGQEVYVIRPDDHELLLRLAVARQPESSR